MAQGDGKTVVETADALRMNGLSAASTLEEMSAVLHHQAHGGVPGRAANGQAVDANDPEAVETARLAAQMPADETQLLYSLCLHGRAELGLAPDEYAALTMVPLRLAGLQSPADPAEKNLTRPEAAPALTPVAAAQPAAASLPVAPLPAPSWRQLPLLLRPWWHLWPRPLRSHPNQFPWSRRLCSPLQHPPGGRVCAALGRRQQQRTPPWPDADDGSAPTTRPYRPCVWLKR